MGTQVIDPSSALVCVGEAIWRARAASRSKVDGGAWGVKGHTAPPSGALCFRIMIKIALFFLNHPPPFPRFQECEASPGVSRVTQRPKWVAKLSGAIGAGYQLVASHCMVLSLPLSLSPSPSIARSLSIYLSIPLSLPHSPSRTLSPSLSCFHSRSRVSRPPGVSEGATTCKDLSVYPGKSSLSMKRLGPMKVSELTTKRLH